MPGKRRVLRKIERAGATSTMRPPPRASVPEPEELALPLNRPARPRRSTSPAVAPPPTAPRTSASSGSSPLPTVAAPGVAYESVAPVTATVITPPFNTTLAPAAPRSGGPLRGVIVGATLGLAIVGVFVVGTRLAVRSAPAAADQGPSQPAATAPRQAPQPQPVLATSATAESVPLVAATQLPLAPAPKTRGHRAWKTAKGAPQVAASATATASAAPSASGAQSPEPDPDDSAQSLVPVIPAASAPPVDPFVKAVQTDIDEDSSKRR